MRRERICNQQNERWRACVRLSTMLIVASIMMSVLFLMGCASKRQHVEVHESKTVEETKRVTMDSVVQEERLTETVEPVPAESVMMRIPIKAIEMLPEGAEYHQKKGRVAVSARRKGLDLSIEARADSVPRVKEHREQRMRSMSGEVAEEQKDRAKKSAETEVEQCSNGIKTALVMLLVGLLLGLMVSIGLKRLKKKITNS